MVTLVGSHKLRAITIAVLLVISLAAASLIRAAPAHANSKLEASVAAASTAREAYGIVAIHTGPWGYREIVYGKGTTRQVAEAPLWDVIQILSSFTLWGIPLATMAWAIKYRAQEAVRTGQCYASVRLNYASPYFPGKEPWGCR